MSVLNRLKSRASSREKAPEISSFNPEQLVPKDKEQIVNEIPEKLGVTMTSGTLLEAIYSASRAIIIQREYPPDTEEFNQAQELIDNSRRDLGHRSQQSLDIRHVAKPHAEMAESMLSEISLIIDRSYAPADESSENTPIDSPSIGPIIVSQPATDNSIAA